MSIPFTIFTFTSVFLLTRLVSSQVLREQCLGGTHGDNDEKTCTTTTAAITQPIVPPDCTLVMAKSSLDGFGIFTLMDRRRGSPVVPGDIVIQVPDIMNTVGVEFFQHNYWKSAYETGGMNEGKVVHSVTPGVGMLTNSVKGKSNILPYRVDRDDGDCPRETCKAAGSFTQYHNYTWYIHKDVVAGQELLSPQTEEWFQERSLWDDDDNDHQDPPLRSQEWLRHHGTCLDNLLPKSSSISGRGAFASRFLPKGSIVAPVPVVPIFDWEITLNTIKVKESKQSETLEQQWQLLLNYCFGHPQSSMVLFPYSPIVNLINHHDTPNVKLQWSVQQSNDSWLRWRIPDLEDHADEPGLVLELVALRDLQPGDEIVMDYGSDWKAAWDNHHRATTAATPNEPRKRSNGKKTTPMYTPAHVMDEVATKIRTSAEQKEYPYPNNLRTSCFYDYPDNKNDTTTATNSDGGITTVPWNWTRRVFDWTNLHPCTILKRDETSSFYTVQILRNARQKGAYGGNTQGDRVEKKKSYHIVSKVPRPAIRFTDKVYTTDQHLTDAFRHWIGIPDEIFPDAWRDERGSDPSQ